MPSSSSVQLDTIPVLLLKTESHPTDKYRSTFRSTSSLYDCHFLPPLEHVPAPAGVKRLSTLFHAGALTEGPAQVYGGFIFTSQRAVEIACKTLRGDAPTFAKLWDRQAQVYVVGDSTYNVVHALLGTDEDIIVGRDTGNGDKLAALILQHYNERHEKLGGGPKKPLLFITGDNHRDIIPNTLQSPNLPQDQRIEVEELAVYQTAPNPTFPSTLRAILPNFNPASTHLWLVVFSPANIAGMFEGLDMLSDDGTAIAPGKDLPKGMRIAAIGPTTRDALLNRWGISPHAVADMPTPKALAAAVHEFGKGGPVVIGRE
jgi:uroporphyrinogen-III synthase